MKPFLVFTMALVSGLMIPASMLAFQNHGTDIAVLISAISAVLAVAAVWQCGPTDPDEGYYLDHYLFDNGFKIWVLALAVSSVFVFLSL